MASTTLSLCSSFTTQCRISQKLNQPTLSALNTHVGFSSLSSNKPSFTSLVSPRVVLPSVPKVSESGGDVIDVELESTEIVEIAKEVPKREEIFAVVMIGSRQYIVFPGRFIYTQRLKGANVNDKIVLNKVLLIGMKTRTYIGKPIVQNAAVHAIVEEQGSDDKVIVFKYKKKKNYRRNIGHRQPNTRIRITGITGYQDSPFVTLNKQD